VLITLGEFGLARAPDVSAVFVWMGTSFMVIAGSYSIGRLILLGTGCYESRKRKTWLISHQIDLRKEILTVAHRTIDGINLHQKFSALYANIEKALKKLEDLCFAECEAEPPAGADESGDSINRDND